MNTNDDIDTYGDPTEEMHEERRAQYIDDIIDEIEAPRFEKEMRVLGEMQDYVHAINRLNGWFDDQRTFGDEIALLHSEVSEALEEFRDGRMTPWYEVKDPETRQVFTEPADDLGPRVGFLTTSMGIRPKPIGVPSEMADVLVRLLDICHRYDIDLSAAFREKLAYNATRGHKHGGKAL